jgi:two-component system, CitB family, response regulator
MLRVLIVEDDFRVAQVNRGFVSQMEGFAVTGIAATAEQAEQAVDELQPDLILLDLYLPDGSGLELLRRLRSSGCGADVIVITAAKEAATLQDALRGGVVDYILKPYRMERFTEALRQYRETRTQIARTAEVEQSQVDRLLRRHTRTDGQERPKGIDGLTLDRVAGALRTTDQPLTADEFGARVGLSRTTARRYLEYLVEVGKATVQAAYGDVGRPERLYVRV